MVETLAELFIGDQVGLLPPLRSLRWRTPPKAASSPTNGAPAAQELPLQGFMVLRIRCLRLSNTNHNM
jgi:hypothetical protein